MTFPYVQRLTLLFMLLLLALPFAACSSDDPPVSPPSEEEEETGGDATPYGAHVQQLIRYYAALCENELACPANRREASETAEFCIDANMHKVSLQTPELYGGLHTSIDEDTLVAHETFFKTTCVPESGLDEALLYAPFRGELPNGEPCSLNVQCASGGKCEADPDTPGAPALCVAPTIPLGGACADSTECIGRSHQVFCAQKFDEPEGKCAPLNYPSPKNLNEACGEDANGYNQPCKMALWCHRGTCVEPLRNGEICGGGLDSYGCARGMPCRPTYNMNLGVCVTPVYLNEGESCEAISTSLEYCSVAQHLICDEDSLRCTGWQIGCFHKEDCEGSEFCSHELKCVPPGPTGALCWHGSQCASARCDVGNGICLPL